jgi:hypothetical protein
MRRIIAHITYKYMVVYAYTWDKEEDAFVVCSRLFHFLRLLFGVVRRSQQTLHNDNDNVAGH